MRNLLFIAIILLSFSACKKEEKSPTDPTNPNNPCFGITCLNGGHCVNGDCDCPTQWTGPDCGNQKTPSSILIDKIIVNHFPPTDNGAGWDLTSGADIYVKVYTESETLIYKHASFYQNADPNQPHSFTISPPISITNTSGRYIVRLYDNDGTSSDDYIAGIIFNIYSNTNGFPSKMRFDAGAGFDFDMEVRYNF